MNAKHQCGFGATKVPAVVNPLGRTYALVDRSNGHSVKGSTEPPSRQFGKVRGQRPDDRDWCPRWIQKLAGENATAEDVVKVAVRRLKATTSEATLLETQKVINEFAREPRNAAMLQRQVTTDLLMELHRAGGTQ